MVFRALLGGVVVVPIFVVSGGLDPGGTNADGGAEAELRTRAESINGELGTVYELDDGLVVVLTSIGPHPTHTPVRGESRCGPPG